MLANITNYYWQRQAQPITLLKKKLKTQGRPKRLDLTSADDSHPHLKSGLADWCRRNNQYRALIVDKEVHDRANTDILEEFSKILSPHQISESAIDRSQNQDINMESIEDIELPVTPKTASRIVYLRATQNWSMSSICSKFGVKKHQVAQIFKTI